MANFGRSCLLELIIAIAIALGKKDDEKLILVQAVWRHGLDTPPYDFIHPTGEGYREALPQGFVQSFQLGKAMRERYVEDISFLTPEKSTSQVYIRSIDYNRSLTTAAAMMAGMFPIKEPTLEKTKGWPSNWVPVAIHTVPLEQDMLLNMGLMCPTAISQEANMALIPKYNKTLRKNQDIFDFLTKKTNMNVTRDNVGLIWASVAKVPKSEVPDWVNKSLVDRMLYLSKEELHYKLGVKELVRIRGGPLAQEILGRMEMKWQTIQNKTDPPNGTADPLKHLKYYGYSCRGMPILWQLATLGAKEATGDRIPPFCTCLLYELWKKGDEAHVSVLFSDGETGKFSPLQVDGCPDLPARCPLSTMRKVVSRYIMNTSEWCNECGLVNASSIAAGQQTYESLAVILGIIVIVLTLLIIVLLCALMRPKRQSGYTDPDESTRLLSSSKDT